MSNKSEVTGDNNIILQDINSSQIHITINDGLPEEVKAQKKKIKELIDELKDHIDQSLGKIEEEPTDVQSSKTIQRIIKAIKAERCVLFLGPELALNKKNDLSLHESKFKQLANEGEGEVIFNEAEGFFEPPLGPDLELDLLEYYKDDFQEDNEIGKETLTYLAELPFSLVISSSPDETIREIFDHYDKDKNFQHYEGHLLAEVMPDKDEPLIINSLGSITSNGGQYIYTAEDFYDYFKHFEFSAPVKHEIQRAKHLLFVGFDLRKWHMKLILFMLEIHLKKDNASRSLLSHITHEEVSEFLQNQFQVTQVDNNCLEFSRQLSAEARKEKIAIHLEHFFFKKQIAKLVQLSIQVTDTKEMKDLYDIEQEIDSIADKVASHDA